MAEQVINVAKESSIQNVDLELDTVRNELTALKSELAIVKNAIVNSGGSVIKSIQHGIITITASNQVGTAEINTVDINKSLIILNGSHWSTTTSSNGASAAWDVLLSFQNNSTVQAKRIRSSEVAYVGFSVVEFN